MRKPERRSLGGIISMESCPSVSAKTYLRLPDIQTLSRKKSFSAGNELFLALSSTCWTRLCTEITCNSNVTHLQQSRACRQNVSSHSLSWRVSNLCTTKLIINCFDPILIGPVHFLITKFVIPNVKELPRLCVLNHSVV